MCCKKGWLGLSLAAEVLLVKFTDRVTELVAVHCFSWILAACNVCDSEQSTLQSVFLQPIPGTDEYRYNFWGYSTVNFFAPMARYSQVHTLKLRTPSPHDSCASVDSFRHALLRPSIVVTQSACL